jgi:chromosome partitioning protein
MTKIITLTTSKGGAGKSTLTRNLGAHWVNLGHKVVIIDADPQGSIISRHNTEGPLKDMVVVADPEESISNTINEFRNKTDFLLIDTGGFRNKTTVRALSETDLALIPLKPSADDVAGAVITHNLIEELNQTPERAGRPITYRMILTMTQQGTTISKHVRSELTEIGYLLIESEMRHRVAYPEAAISGLSPCILDPEGPAARDIAAIVAELNKVAFKKNI